jgi:hypothetical protein
MTITLNADNPPIKIDGHDSAIIGMDARSGALVYGYWALVDSFVSQGMDHEEAIEWIDYNIVGAYVGEMTPIIVGEMEEEDIKDLLDEHGD